MLILINKPILLPILAFEYSCSIVWLYRSVVVPQFGCSASRDFPLSLCRIWAFPHPPTPQHSLWAPPSGTLSKMQTTHFQLGAHMSVFHFFLREPLYQVFPDQADCFFLSAFCLFSGISLVRGILPSHCLYFCPCTPL